MTLVNEVCSLLQADSSIQCLRRCYVSAQIFVDEPNDGCLDYLQSTDNMAMPCAGAIHAGKRSAAGASEDALARVQPLLRAISESSGAAVPCLARACMQLKAKSRLQAAKIAAGLQDVIAAHGGLLSYLI